MKIITIILFITFTTTFVHNTHQAFFQFSDHHGKLRLTVKMENADLDLMTNSKNLKVIEGRDYIKKHFQCMINDAPVYFKFTSTKSSKNWTYFTFKTNVKTDNIKTVNITNDAFIDLHHKFKNSIDFKFGQFSKSYEMNENRTNISVNVE